mmetsp:Transcript_6451/g.19065  ORF Transcript_6451/g.19065 Transcript_6451/m.19065 type:complete len:232 (-) Transcript_6451:396-1091(-)
MAAKTGVAHDDATRADDPPSRNVRTSDPFSPSLLSLDPFIIFPLPSIKIISSPPFAVVALFPLNGLRLPLKDGNGTRINSSNCNPMRQQMPFDTNGNAMFMLPELPYRTPPTDDAMMPRLQNTNANPPANATVGSNVALSFRSPAAVEMYDIVNGSNPHTHGENDVSNPALYMIGMEVSRSDGSFNEMEAKSDAADCALNSTSSTLENCNWVAVDDDDDGEWRRCCDRTCP